MFAVLVAMSSLFLVILSEFKRMSASFAAMFAALFAMSSVFLVILSEFKRISASFAAMFALLVAMSVALFAMSSVFLVILSEFKRMSASFAAMSVALFAMSSVFLVILLEFKRMSASFAAMFAVLVAMSSVFLVILSEFKRMSASFAMMLISFESTNPFSNLPWFADNAFVVLNDVNRSSTIIVIEVSIKFFKTFPCSADKGTVVPPLVRSSTISAMDTLVNISAVFIAILSVFVSIKVVNRSIWVWFSKTRGFSWVLTANKANGTDVKGALLISVKSTQPSITLKSIFKFFGKVLHLISLKELAYPPVWDSVPIIKFTIP